MADHGDDVEQLVQWVRRVSDEQAALQLAVAALFDRLCETDPDGARKAIRMLRSCSTAPMHAGAASAVETLAEQWQGLLPPARP